MRTLEVSVAVHCGYKRGGSREEARVQETSELSEERRGQKQQW